MDQQMLSYIAILVVLAVILYYFTSYMTDTVEGYASYYNPWWRLYYKAPHYCQPSEEPYHSGHWYWWRHYSKPYYEKYWRDYNVTTE